MGRWRLVLAAIAPALLAAAPALPARASALRPVAGAVTALASDGQHELAWETAGSRGVVVFDTRAGRRRRVYTARL